LITQQLLQQQLLLQLLIHQNLLIKQILVKFLDFLIFQLVDLIVITDKCETQLVINMFYIGFIQHYVDLMELILIVFKLMKCNKKNFIKKMFLLN